MIEIVTLCLHTINTVLLIYLVVTGFKRTSELKRLEETVLLKKLKLSEKVLDQQLNTPDLGQLVQMGAVMPSPQENAPEEDAKIGFKR